MPVWSIILICGVILSAILIISIVLIDRNGTSLCYTDEEILGTFLCVATVVSVLGTILGTPIVGMLEDEYYEIQYENIYSMRGISNDIEGSFFLGTGSVDEETYYLTLVEVDHNSYKLEKYNVRVTLIAEVDDGHYYTVCYKEKWSSYE